MTYWVEDADGPLGDLASIGGLADFRKWALRRRGPIKDFITNGISHDPAALARALRVAKARNANVDHIRLSLHEYAKQASRMLLLTDGADG